MLDWRHFDGIYILVYPLDREQDVFERLGQNADEAQNLRLSLDVVEARLPEEKGRELFFAWYSKGQMLVEMGEYLSASQAFDQVFAVYGQLDMGARPWRMTWYQIGPYLTYFHTGRYQDILALAQPTLDNSEEPKALPETYCRAGLAATQLGQYKVAKDYFENALEYYPKWQAALDGINALP
jgi:tetratricopeptide (TPR) repeat protein